MSRHNRTLDCVLSLALTAAASAPLCAATLYVPSQYATIQDAINAASNGDGVVVADGTYQGVGFEEVDFLGKALKVRSANGAANCILSTKGARFFHFQNGEGSDSSVSGFTMQYGYAQYNGGAILCEQAGPTVLNCVFLGNFAADGGAIACFDGDLTVRNCVFDGNTAQSTGSAILSQGGSLVVSGCTFTGNDGVGGTLYGASNTAVIQNCSFDGNTTIDPGSAITNSFNTSTITGCTINGNTGTAVYNYGATVAMASCGITNNAGNIWGGGMFSRQGASVTVDDCRFSGNSGTDGGAVFVTGPYFETPTSVEFTRCTFTGNSAVNRGGAVYIWLFANVTMRQCDFTGGNINADPDFVDPDGIDNLTGTRDDNLRLLSLSPCINTGNNGLIPTDGADVDEDGNLSERTPLDLDRNRRVAQTIVDMGAYERQQ